MSIYDDRWCNCISLHGFKTNTINWKKWFYFVEELISCKGLEFTRICITGSKYGHSSKSILYKNGRKKLEANNFEDIEAIYIMSMNDKDDYTTNFIVYADISVDIDSNFSSLVFAIDELLMPFDQEDFKNLASKFIDYTSSEYGYYYRRHLRDSPETYSIGGSGYRSDPEDQRISNNWSLNRSIGLLGNVGILRDVYKLNFLSKIHMDWSIFNTTLGEWIKVSPMRGEVIELMPNKWCWYVPDEYQETIRNDLIPTKILLARIEREEALRLSQEYSVQHSHQVK